MSQPPGSADSPHASGGAAPGSPRLPRCEECGRLFFYPRLRCPWCHGSRISYPAAPRIWAVRSFAWVLRPQSRSFDARVPILLMTGTAEGVHLIAEAQGWQPASQPRIGESVVLTRLRLTEGAAVPVYVPAGEE
jgi:uncharacterized protein